MKKLKTTSCLLCVTILLCAAGCSSAGSSEGGNNSSRQELQTSSASSAQSVSSGTGGSASAGSQAESSGGTESNSSGQQAAKDGEDVLKAVRAAIETKVPVMLPADVPVEQGGFLTAVASSQETSYKAAFYVTDKKTEVNAEGASKGTPIAAVEGSEYKDESAARESITGYQKVDLAHYPDTEDLGNNITAGKDAGAGHQYYLWNEGNWSISVNYPTDSTYVNTKYPDSSQLARDVVAYLDKNMLPAPKNTGVIRIDNWSASAGTVVQWQNGKTVYQVSGTDPLTVLKIAVAMQDE